MKSFYGGWWCSLVVFGIETVPLRGGLREFRRMQAEHVSGVSDWVAT